MPLQLSFTVFFVLLLFLVPFLGEKNDAHTRAGRRRPPSLLVVVTTVGDIAPNDPANPSPYGRQLNLPADLSFFGHFRSFFTARYFLQRLPMSGPVDRL